MAGSRVGLFDNLNIPIHRDAQHREDLWTRDRRRRSERRVPAGFARTRGVTVEAWTE